MLQLTKHDPYLGRRQRPVPWHERRNGCGSDIIRRIGGLLAMKDRKAEYELHNVPHMHGGRRRSAFLYLGG